MRTNSGFVTAALLGAVLFTTSALAQQDSAELAKKLSNPVAALISVPLQLNYDQDIGPAEAGEKWALNIQPVVPIALNDDWNVISRTILPVVYQDDLAPGAGSQFGLSDVVQSLFFSPKAPTSSGWIWGVGPVFLLPTGTDDLLTAVPVGRRSHGRGAEAGERLDVRRAGQPPLVLRGRRRPV